MTMSDVDDKAKKDLNIPVAAYRSGDRLAKSTIETTFALLQDIMIYVNHRKETTHIMPKSM